MNNSASNGIVTFYTVTEVANKLSIYRKTVINWIKSGELEGYKFRNTYRIKSDDLNSFILKSKVGDNNV